MQGYYKAKIRYLIKYAAIGIDIDKHMCYHWLCTS